MAESEHRWDLAEDRAMRRIVAFRPLTDGLVTCSVCAAVIGVGVEDEHRRWHLVSALGGWRPQLSVHGLAVPEDPMTPVRLAYLPLRTTGAAELDQVADWVEVRRGKLVSRDEIGLSAFLPRLLLEPEPNVSIDFSCELEGDQLQVLFVAALGDSSQSTMLVAQAELRMRQLEAQLLQRLGRR